MAEEPEIIIDEVEEGNDEEMAEDGTQGQPEESGLEDIEPDVPERTTFLDYLRSPIVELLVGSGDDATVLHAHQLLLAQSTFLHEACAAAAEADNSRVQLADVDTAAAASVLEYLYKGDYFPTLSGQSLESDPSVPTPDHDGIALLRHARVYTLAKRWQLGPLATLAHRKIHLTQSTARGEIAYARFVYQESDPEDVAIRRPVAQFWAMRSHVLRHEAEQEFRRMCLEFPQFGFDVLSLVLDAQEKRSARMEASSAGGSARKRARVSTGVS